MANLTTGWVLLTGGFVPELPERCSQDEAARFLDGRKGPGDFLRDLVKSLGGRVLKPDWVVDHKEILEQNPLTAKVRLDIRWETEDPDVGLKGRLVQWERTTAYPIQQEWETFGLRNVLLFWAYDYHKWGQLGYCEFRHRELRVLFRNEGAMSEVSEVWKGVFDRNPEWTAEEKLTT